MFVLSSFLLRNLECLRTWILVPSMWPSPWRWPNHGWKKRGGRRDVFVGFSFCSTCGVYNFRDVGVRFLLVVLFFGGSEFSILILGALWKTWNDERLLSCTNPRNQSWDDSDGLGGTPFNTYACAVRKRWLLFDSLSPTRDPTFGQDKITFFWNQPP